jgi:hypothetical protein
MDSEEEEEFYTQPCGISITKATVKFKCTRTQAQQASGPDLLGKTSQALLTLS